MLAAVGTAAALGYLLGAIPVGLLVGRVAAGVDLRRHGSGRTGTTNALRTIGPAGAVAVLLLDLLKGLAAVVVARWLLGDDERAAWAAATAGVAAVIGHNHSIFIGFGGGRGVATASGALLGILPLAILILGPVVIGVVAASGYVSLGSVIGALLLPIVVAPLVALGLAGPPALAYAVVVGAFVTWAHRDNIARLRAGTERRIGRREG